MDTSTRAGSQHTPATTRVMCIVLQHMEMVANGHDDRQTTNTSYKTGLEALLRVSGCESMSRVTD